MDWSLARSSGLSYDSGDKAHNCNQVNEIGKMLGVIDAYSTDVAYHCLRVSRYSTGLGRFLGLPVTEIRVLWSASLLHDIGKIKIPKDILCKPAKLTDEEYTTVKTHSRKGFEIVKKSGGMDILAEIILHHHERIDGKGYPAGKQGQEIPLMSRILAIADSFDAMTTGRPYRNALSDKEAITELKNGKETQFDPELVDLFISINLPMK